YASFELDVNRTRNLLIWSQTRYHCATNPRVIFQQGFKLLNIIIELTRVYKQKRCGGRYRKSGAVVPTPIFETLAAATVITQQ
ncbi:hypothetical protein MARPO_0159s0018, partial [Marchantia polymorpha]